jgi:hypothetical protein
MPPFPKPAFDYDYELDAQIAALRAYEQIKSGRAIPPKQSDRVLRSSPVKELQLRGRFAMGPLASCTPAPAWS